MKHLPKPLKMLVFLPPFQGDGASKNRTLAKVSTTFKLFGIPSASPRVRKTRPPTPKWVFKSLTPVREINAKTPLICKGFLNFAQDLQLMPYWGNLL